MDCSTQVFPVHHQLLELTQTHVYWVGDAIQPSHPLSSPSLLAVSPSNEYSGLISLRMNLWGLLEFHGTLKSLLQHHSSKASILLCSAFFIVQLSHLCMTTGKTIALTRRTFVGKVMSLLLNMLSRLVITFLLRSKCLSISWVQSPSAVILEPPKIVSHCFPIYLP